MKALFTSLLFFSGLLKSPAQIFADFQTTLGDFTVSLDYLNSPRTVANFLTLAEGTRPWVDSATGQVITDTPYYNGITFHRVASGFVNQAGSQNSLGTDGPGYTFPDETSNGLTFDSPYLFAMANSGPNTNGSQFFITVATPTFLNGIHTIFGSVTSGTAIVDTINAVPTTNEKPDTDVVINSVTIRRVGAPAQAFDEFAQLLPLISAPNLELQFPGPQLLFSQAPNTTALISLGDDLSSWTNLTRTIAPHETAATSFDPTNSLTQTDRQFFTGALVTWPSGAFLPNPLSSHTLTLDAPFSTPITFNFDNTGTAGTWSLPIPNNNLNGTFTVLQVVDNQLWRGALTLNLSGLALGNTPIPFWVLDNIRLDDPSPSQISGRVDGRIFDNTSTFVGNLNGTHTLSLP
ncbi:MAG: peptidylprolyl isomerase [Verrucomicrobiota bacterium]